MAGVKTKRIVTKPTKKPTIFSKLFADAAKKRAAIANASGNGGGRKRKTK